MISSKDIEDYSYLVSARFEAINTHYLKLVAKQINEIGRLGPANLHRLQQMAKYNQNIEEINRLLAQETNRTLEELYQVYDMSGFSIYGDYSNLYKANGVNQIPFAKNMAIQGYLNSVKSLTQGTFMNMANTTVVSHSKYQQLIDTAIDAIATGQTDYNSAIRQQMMAIADEGLTVTYASGYKRRLDSAVRMNILEGVRKVNEGVSDVAGQEFGNDGWELTAHALCAVDHIDIQGRQFAAGIADKTVDGITYPSYDLMNENLKRHIGTCNCKHRRFPIMLGISEPAYTNEELARYKANSDKKVTLTTGYDKEGNPITKTVTKYEATQVQRNLETEIRRAKDRHIIAENSGDTIGTKQAKDRILALRKTYKRISEEAGLTPKWDRTFVAGYTGKQTTPKPITLNYKQSISDDIARSVNVTELSDDLQDMLVRYTKGEFDGVCNYSQYLIDPNSMSHSKGWVESHIIPDISEESKKQTRKIMNIIDNQPIKDKMLYRLERNVVDGVEGDVLNLGIRSATRDSEFVDKVFNTQMEGFEFEERHFTGAWTEYRFINSKSLDISPISAYASQEEELIMGSFKIVKTETIENIKAGGVEVTKKMSDVAQNVEYFTSKSGKEMVRYNYDDKQLTDTLEKFKTREVQDFIWQKGQMGRKIIWLEKI